MVLGGWGFSRQIYTAASTMNKLSDSRGRVAQAMTFWFMDYVVIHRKVPDVLGEAVWRGKLTRVKDKLNQMVITEVILK